MTLTGELISAVRTLRADATIPQPYIEVLAGWLLSCHEDLSKASTAADMYGSDPLTIVDEPDSVRHALGFAREVNATTEATS